MIQLEGERTTRARTGRFEVSPPKKKAPTESLEKNWHLPITKQAKST